MSKTVKSSQRTCGKLFEVLMTKNMNSGERAQRTCGTGIKGADPWAVVGAEVVGGGGNPPRPYSPSADETDARAGSSKSPPTCGAECASSALGLPGSTSAPGSGAAPKVLMLNGSASCLAITCSRSGIQSVISMSSSSLGSSLILPKCGRQVVSARPAHKRRNSENCSASVRNFLARADRKAF